MNDLDELARRVERHWGKESRDALVRDEERVRRLTEGALAASRARPTVYRILPTWTSGIVLCVTAALLGSKIYRGNAGEAAPAEQHATLAPIAPQATDTDPEPAASTSMTTPPPTIAVADLPAAKPAPAVRASSERALTPPQPLSAPTLSPAELFARANEERRRRDFTAAEADYRTLIQEAPSSPEALLSHLVLGRMIEDREPLAALTLFEHYLGLGKSSVLAEEARASRARILSKLGRKSEAASAWRELLELHPGTVHRSEAEAGLRVPRESE